ncbi:efflux RND transporter permease subunit [Reyranella sp. CPCC 100927]|uniref:efflux RND transporter permease subunit n=1 Tax=Reyranella sp. CPCC 100927 TaxID=2599616 RepID=UPI0011B49B7B|nr:efflux RND transporter permease subunit [Reyranella sp. CPCC 100927]TWS96611.1 efflux RND transporter permease subunit [Reyranella sp. CPCC 100927]
MSIYELCIRRPVFATVLSLILMLVGAVSYQRLSVREYPNIDEPIVSVETVYRGASPEIIEAQVTQVLEESIAGIEGIEILSSRSRPEQSTITVRFRLSVDPDAAASDVRDRVARVRRKLPDEIEEPVIAKVEADAQPIIFLPFTSSHHSTLEISDYADRYVKPELQNLPGVAGVNIYGERRYAMRIWVDRTRLAAYNLTVQDIETALRQQNVEIPSGRIESTDREFTILSRTGLVTTEQFDRIIVKQTSGFLVRLGDVARAELGAVEERRTTRYNGHTAVTLGVVKQSTANPLDVSRSVRERLPGLRERLPQGMQIDVAYDTSVFIEESIKSVLWTIVEALALVVVVIVLFLRSFRAALIPVVTIPVSLVGTFAIMFAFGFSVNTLTLLAMVLAIGLVVDDAIVVLENVHRHIEEGMSPMRAAVKGTGEIVFAVIAMTLTLVAVYAPVAFTPGRTGKLFVEFALSLAGAVLISGFIALTLTPMMCSRLLKDHETHGRLYNLLERGLAGLSSAYRRALDGALRARPLVLMLLLATVGGGAWLGVVMKSELSPLEDRGVILVLGTAPEGATIDYSSRYARAFEPIGMGLPEVGSTYAVAGSPTVTDAVAFLRLHHWDDRSRKQQDIAEGIRPAVEGIPGVRAFVNNPPSLGQSFRSRPVQFVILSSRPFAEIEEHIERLMDVLNDNPGLVSVDHDLRLNKPQIDVQMKRDKIADLGLSVEATGRTLETLFGGRQVTRFNREGKQYDVIVQVEPIDRQTPYDLSQVYVRSRGGDMVQLSNIVTADETVAPKELNRFNQLRSVTITANLAPDYSLGEALAFMERQAKAILPADFRVDYNGTSREFKESGHSLVIVFLLALGFIFLVLSAQFESFVDPLIIMISVPMSMTGAFAALHLSGCTLNIYSQIGLVTLIGLITKHGILIVQFANQRRADLGESVRQAVVEAAVIRLRPILMTTGAMVLGALPLALASGAGAESRHQIGWVVVGGMTFGTVLTLFVVPTVYTFISRERRPNPDLAPASLHAGED